MSPGTDTEPPSPQSSWNAQSRVRFASNPQVLPAADRDSPEPSGSSFSRGSSSLPPTAFSTNPGASAQWHFPGDEPQDSGAREDQYATMEPHENCVESRRASDGSDTTLQGQDELEATPRLTFTSYRHPYDIQVPPGAHGTFHQESQYYSRASEITKDGTPYSPKSTFDVEKAIDDTCSQLPRRRRGYLTNLIDLYNASEDFEDSNPELERRDAIINVSKTNRLVDPLAYNDGEILDPDDPAVTGVHKRAVEDVDDVDKYARRAMNYKERRKVQEKIRIEFNISSVVHRQEFLMRLSKALLTFGAPSHRIESQLLSAARILEVDAEFTHMPGLIIASFGDEETKTSQAHFVKCGGRLSLGNLHNLHMIYREVMHDEISARKATDEIDALLGMGPLRKSPVRITLVFLIASLICPLAFGGSIVDMGVAGAGAVFLICMQIGLASKRNVIYANVFEILSVIVISFLARGLSTIRSQIFCYAAISSAGIVTILPGYLILTSSLDLASKNIISGSIRMVYALIYTLFLGFGLQFGSDLFLVFMPNARRELDTLAAHAMATVTVTGSYIADGSANLSEGLARSGSFSFTPSTQLIRQNIFKGCYRPPSFPWYLQPFPWWAQFIIVPVFSILSSLNNEQPVNLDLVVMVVISCTSYAANKVADHFIFNRSDVVSAIGAFVVGLLGNLYSRRMGGTAFTSMVTGVLFLVPSGLSEAGGITAQNSATQIGGAMVSVTIGITVGLFMSQALVYMVGSRKSAAIFSF